MKEIAAGRITSKLRRRMILIVAIGILALLFMTIVSMALGTTNYSLGEVLDSVSHAIRHGVGTGVERTMCNLRLPRVLATFAVGAGLSMAGIVFQAIVRNPLVDPYMTGVSSGAGFGAALYLYLFAGAVAGSLSNYIMPVFAFVFAIVAFFLTYFMSRFSGNGNTSFVLAGVICAMGFSSVTTILMMSDDRMTHDVMSFLYGSFSTIGWETAEIIIPVVIVLSLVFIIYSRKFNVILLGREQAMELGVDYDTFRIAMMVIASLLTAVCVAFVGIISFVGLIVPHIARMALGGDHRLIMPASMVLGALLLSAADLLVKESIGLFGLTIPIGAITTIIGIPFFVYILKRRGKGYGQ